MKNLFVTAALTLSLSFAGLSLVAPGSASACGGYGPPTASSLVRTVVYAHVRAATIKDTKAMVATWTNLTPASATKIAADYQDHNFVVKSVRLLTTDLAVATVAFSCDSDVCLDLYTVKRDDKGVWTIQTRDPIRTLAAFAAPAKR